MWGGMLTGGFTGGNMPGSVLTFLGELGWSFLFVYLTFRGAQVFPLFSPCPLGKSDNYKTTAFTFPTHYSIFTLLCALENRLLCFLGNEKQGII